MIKYEQEYIDYIVANGVGKNDQVASSPKSYASYLKSISNIIGEDISPIILSKEDDITSIVGRLLGKRTKKTLGNYKSAMLQYVNMVKENRFDYNCSFLINKRELKKYFNINDEIATGGNTTKFRITVFNEKTVTIQPTEAKSILNLYYEQINAVYSSFDVLEYLQTIGDKVSKALELHNLRGETSTETYLYGFALALTKIPLLLLR